MGAVNAQQIGIIVVLLISTILNTAYFAPVVIHAFFGKAPDGAHVETGIREASPAMVVPLMITAILSVVIGIFPDFFMRIIQGIIR